MACLLGLGGYLSQGRPLGGGDSRALLAMETLKDQLETTLRDPEAIALTMRLNTNRFTCLSDGGDACRERGGMFIFYSREGKTPLPLSQMGDEKGLTVDKTSCGNFPAPACPLHVEASWKPVDDSSCEAKRSLLFQLRVVLNSGSLFLDWKTEKVVTAEVALNAKALCRCEGKTFLAGECRLEIPRDLTSVEGRGVDLADERREEREAAEREARAGAETGQPECPPVIQFRNEEFAVVDISSAGETDIQLEGEDNRCQSIDVFRFQCAAKQDKGKTAGEWIFAGVEKGICPVPEEVTTTADATSAPASGAPMSDAAAAAAEAEASGRAPAQAVPTGEEPQLLEIKQGFVSEEIQQ